MWKTFIEHVIKEWNTLISAPGIFVLTLVLAFALASVSAFYVVRWAYESRLKILKERINAKDDQLTEYRERLHLVHTTDTSYSLLTNQELRKKALSVTTQVRDFLKEQIHIGTSPYQEMSAAKSENERRRIWENYGNAFLRSMWKFKSAYDEKFKVDTILLRDELLSRLPKDARDDKAYSMYEYPTNPLGMEMVAYDLERLTKSLP